MEMKKYSENTPLGGSVHDFKTHRTRSWVDGASRKHPLADYYDVFFLFTSQSLGNNGCPDTSRTFGNTQPPHNSPPPEAGTKRPKLKKEIIKIPRRKMNHVKNGMIIASFHYFRNITLLDKIIGRIAGDNSYRVF